MKGHARGRLFTFDGARPRLGQPCSRQTRGTLAILACVAGLVGGATIAAASVAANRPPKFARIVKFTLKTDYEYDDAGRLFGGVTTITIKTPPKDPDGDRLTYRWTATSTLHDGSQVRDTIRGRRLSAKWTRDLDFGELAAGKVQVTARDGHGGRATHTFKFQRGAG